ncbi:hypothetical protein BDN67DRAFT_982120 [Paxillus ammoniavirescens]|nr:hypothetical protein BDN67DRAFT_982120 [Paxillus ammoniavirescens]
MTTPPVGSIATTAAMHLSTASPEHTEQLSTDQPMEDVRHKANSLAYALDSNPRPRENMCSDAANISSMDTSKELGDISSMHDGPEVIPSPVPPNGSTVGPRESVRGTPIFLRDVSFGNQHLIETDLGDGHVARDDGSLTFHSDGEARVRVIDFDLVLAPHTIRPVSSS